MYANEEEEWRRSIVSEQGRRRRSERIYYDQEQNTAPTVQQMGQNAQYMSYPQNQSVPQAYPQDYPETQAYSQVQPYQQAQVYQQSQPYQPVQGYQQAQVYPQQQNYLQFQNGYGAQYPASTQNGIAIPVQNDYVMPNAPRRELEKPTREELIAGLNSVLRDVEKILAARKRQIDLVAQLRQQMELVSKDTFISFFTKGKGGVLFLIEIIIALFAMIPVINASGGGVMGFIMWVIYAGVGFAAHLRWIKPKNPLEAKIAAVVCGLMNIYLLTFAVRNLSLLSVILSVVFVALVILGVRAINKSRAQENERIAQHNEEVNQMYQQTIREIATLQASMKKNYGSWYPKDYFCLDAVKFFISAVENFRADSIKEAINLYESSEHQRRMEAAQGQLISGQQQMLDSQDKIIAGQKIMVSHLDYANVLNMVNLKMQRETQAAIRQASNQIQGAIHSSAAQTRAEISNSARAINNSIQNSETNVTVHVDEYY